MKFRALLIVAAGLIAGLVPSVTFAQAAPVPAVPSSAEVAPITESEFLKMQIAQLTKELVDANAAKAESEKQRDGLRMQLTMIQAAPQREAHSYDWQAGKFRRLSDGMVWDAEAKKHVADEKTPKPADKSKPGGGL